MIRRFLALQCGFVRLKRRRIELKRRVQREPKRQTYLDIALTPVSTHDTDVLALFTQSAAARAAVQRARAVGLLKP